MRAMEAAYLVTEVGINAHKLATVDSGGSLHVHSTSTVVRAVAA